MIDEESGAVFPDCCLREPSEHPLLSRRDETIGWDHTRVLLRLQLCSALLSVPHVRDIAEIMPVPTPDHMRSFHPVLRHPVGMNHVREVNNISPILIFAFHEGKEPQQEPIMQ